MMNNVATFNQIYQAGILLVSMGEFFLIKLLSKLKSVLK